MGFSKFTTRVRRVNAMILNTKKRYGNDSHIVKRIQKTVEKVMGEGRQYFSTKVLDKASLRDISNFDTALSLIENSAYTSKAGRERMNEKARETFASNNPQFSLAAYDRYIDMKSNIDNYLSEVKAHDETRYDHLYATVQGNIYVDSFQVIDDLETEYNISESELQDIVFKYIDYLDNDSIANKDKQKFFEFLRDEIRKKEAEKEEEERAKLESNQGFAGRNPV